VTAPAAGVGTFGAVVWPAYVGVCEGDPGPGPHAFGEPTGVEYQRGQIHWAVEDSGEIVGRAFVHVGPGYYTHFAYFSGPEGPRMSGKRQMAQPMDWRRAPATGNVIEVYPLTNPDLSLNKAQGIDY
jgi:hypothetical protein